jgi:carbamoylphosphate synthase large subunit
MTLEDQLELLAVRSPGYVVEHWEKNGFVVFDDYGEIIARGNTAKEAIEKAIKATEDK